MKQYNLSALSKQVNIPVRKLRYVMDHDLVPDRTWFVVCDEVGTPRHFDDITACFITCSAMMLIAGVKRDAVYEFMDAIGEIRPPLGRQLNLPLVATAFTIQEGAIVTMADSTHIRLQLGKQISSWYCLGKKPVKDPTFEPFVSISIDLGRIRDILR